MSRHQQLSLFLGLVLGFAACGGDAIVFPDVDPDILEEVCIQGELAVDGAGERSGTITDDDCTEGFDDGFWEGWRVRVSEERTYTIEISSGFDSWLTVVRINDVDNIDDGTVDEIAEDDDGGEGVDALVTVTLRPDTEYVVFVSGYDQSETGSYTLNIR